MLVPEIKVVAKWMFKFYIVWSVCADIIVIGGIIYLIFFWNKYLTIPTQYGININMDVFTHTLLAVGSLAAFYFAGQYFAGKKDNLVAEEAVDFVIKMLERDGFIQTAKAKDGEFELIPISEIISKALRDAKA